MPVEDNATYSSDSAEYATDDETSLYERRILKLKRRRARAFLSEFKDGEVIKISELLPTPNPSLPPSPVNIRKRSKKRFSTPLVALQPRKSTRLSSKNVDYQGLDEDFKEPPVYRRRNSNGKGRRRTPRINLAPRQVDFNPDALSGVVCYTSQKVYSQSGTTCHQCRQKTVDLKSRCYSPYCRGVRGMFCGYCLLQRYGEKVDVVLRDPNWKCPPCRKICNCSICRRSYGKEPTGQLFPSVSEKGYTNVLEYLAKIGDDKLEDEDADDESESEDENVPPVKKAKTYNDGLEPFVKLERINLSFDETGWNGVATWRWLANDDTCGICRLAFDGCCPDCKVPGDECPLVWGQCSHCFHIHCIMKWLNSQQVNQQCPMCRQEWKFRE